ncbi:MAG: Acetophenone carboxylase gamma subunit [Nitrospira sp.]|nr:Acetophenone carboxylase gamma subunit [Nitrospira sp.]
MRGSIDIDIGGTFTDCFVRFGDKIDWCKKPTTGFDLGKAMLDAIGESASRLGLGLPDLLKQTDIIRYSTTLALNSLLEHKGPRLGYIATDGFQDNILIGRGSQWADGKSIKEQRNIAGADKPMPLIPRELMIGVKERIDHKGDILRPFDEDDFLRKLDGLVDKGVRGFVVCLLWSHVNPIHERRIRELIEYEYNSTYLGSMPVFLSSSTAPRRLEYTRAMSTLLNAYLHESMYEDLSSIGWRLRSSGYRQPLMMVHNTGGMASIFRSAAIQTFSGGPVAGLIGSATLGEHYGYNNVILTDMGGTSFDIGLVVQGSTRFYNLFPTISNWRIDATMLDTHSIGAGGGSIARINQDLGGRLEVGPESAGSLPGPACYDLGGREATVTDADLVLGYLNAAGLTGGSMQLNLRRAERVIREKIAEPLGLSVSDAALMIKRVIDGQMGAVIHKETVLKGYDPREFVLFSAGGAGPVHACGYAQTAGIRRITVFPFASVFCAYGSSTMDVLHVYERSQHFSLFNGSTGEWMHEFDRFNETIKYMTEQALRDFAGEGFDTDAVQFELELDMKFGGQLNVKRVKVANLRLTNLQDARDVYAAFEEEYSAAYSSLGLNPDAGVEIDAMVLKARLPKAKAPLLSVAIVERHEAKAPDHRDVYWNVGEGTISTPVFQSANLSPGTWAMGPALIESENTTIVVGPLWKFEVDGMGAIVMANTTEEAGDA